jgi:formylglycine-generating enzyme required for sulfatase activity
VFGWKVWLPRVTEVGVELATTIEGTVLNYRYQVEQVFNDKGGMGLIYRATDLNLRSTVVLKKSRFVDEQSRGAFKREARLLYGLRHNALPRVIDYFITEDASQFFVMEFIPGQDLSEMLGDRVEKGIGPFPIDTVLDWGDQLLDALHYLHTHEPPIIHRDIKPQNLKLMPNGQIILLDFGLAKGAVSGMTLANASIQGYTPNYAPLEQMRGSGTDARSDIYSLAVTMHCLLTGQMPPDAVSRAIETLSAQPDPLRPIQDINPHFPPPISEALQRACSLNQNERPATALAMRDVLREARKYAAELAAELAAAPLKLEPNLPQAPAAAEQISRFAENLAQPPAEIVKPAVAEAVSVAAHLANPPGPAPLPSEATPQSETPAVMPASSADSGANKTPAAIPVAPVKAVEVVAAQPSPAPASNQAAPVEARKTPAQPINQASIQLREAAAPPAQVLAVARIYEPSPFDTFVDSKYIEDEPSRYDTVVDLPSPEPSAAKPSPPEPKTPEPNPTKPNAPEAGAPSPGQAELRLKREPALVHQPTSVRREAPRPPAEPAPAPTAAPTPAPTGAEPLRPTSLIVIEHKDEGKHGRGAEAQPQAPRDFSGRSRVRPGGGAAPPPQPLVRQKPHEPLERLNRPRPAAPVQRPPNQRPQSFQEPSLTFLREPPAEIETPSQGDVLPNIDLTGVLANPNVGAVAPKGMRSFTEIIALNVRMEMHAIPGGEFLMGAPEKRGYADESPQHRVTLSPFFIGKYPITQAQWRAVMRTNPSHFNGNNHPVDSITWDEAIEFCRRLSYATSRNYRLPTEAEWEFACRAGTTSLYNYGDEEELVMQYAWCLPNSSNHTHPVGEKKPNGWGLYDMHGNVWEWCQDWYGGDYYQYSPNVNPVGPAKGTSRVLRGGSWYSLPNYCRSAGRSNHQPELRDPLVGFRVVCDGKPS